MTTYDLEVAARTIWGEARGVSVDGQKAVAFVIINRMKAGKWGSNLASVCRYPSAFSCWSVQDRNCRLMDALPDTDPLLSTLRDLMTAALDGEADLTGGATSYYAASLKKPPYWAAKMIACGNFGGQLFFRDPLIIPASVPVAQTPVPSPSTT